MTPFQHLPDEQIPIPPEYVEAMAEKMRRHIERKIYNSMGIPKLGPTAMVIGPRLGNLMTTADYLCRKPPKPPDVCGLFCHCHFPYRLTSLYP